jgi:hypothetical protein
VLLDSLADPTKEGESTFLRAPKVSRIFEIAMIVTALAAKIGQL